MGRDFLKEYLNIYFDSPGVALYRAIEADLLSRLEYKEPILDLGCGDGTFSSILFSTEEEKSIIGLDMDTDTIKETRSKRIYRHLITGDIQNIGVASGVFNTILCNCVLEHVPNIREALKEIGRIMNKGGHLYFTVPSEKYGDYLLFYKVYKRMGLFNLAEWYLNRVNRRLNHFHCYPSMFWEEMLSDSGFEVLSARYYSSPKSHILYDLLFNSVGIGKITVLHLHYRIARILNKLGIGFYRVLTIAFFGRFLRRYYDSDRKESENGGGGLFIVAKKRHNER